MTLSQILKFRSDLMIYRRLKFFLQRRFRGWDDSELWNLDHTLAEFMLPRLKVYRQNIYSYPANLQSADEWTSILDEVIESLDLLLAEWEDCYTIEQEEKINRGCMLLGKHLRGMWS